MTTNKEKKNEVSEKKIKGRKFGRREFLFTGGAMLAIYGVGKGYKLLERSDAKGKIVIIGGGSAGISMAARLSRILNDSDITIIDPAKDHFYQPGFSLIGAGIYSADEVIKSEASLIPDGVKWIQDSVTELNPDNNKIVTANSGTISYDYMVLAPGCQMNFELIEGITRKDLGKGNAYSIYDYKGAQGMRKAVEAISSKGGELIFTDTYTKHKCGGAPKKITMLTEHYLRKEKTRDKHNINFYSNSTGLFSVDIFDKRLREIYEERNITPHYLHRLKSVDLSAKKAIFEKLPEKSLAATPEGANFPTVQVDYDLLHFTPPMSAPDFVRYSPLALTEGKLRHGGWADVDKETLVHNKYNNIVAIGDVAGIPTSKTAAGIRIQAPIVTANLISIMEGGEPVMKYDGYTACPILTEYGKLLMCEFGYDKKPAPTVPFVDPGVERYYWWLLKIYGLKPIYFHGMLNGLM